MKLFDINDTEIKNMLLDLFLSRVTIAQLCRARYHSETSAGDLLCSKPVGAVPNRFPSSTRLFSIFDTWRGDVTKDGEERMRKGEGIDEGRRQEVSSSAASLGVTCLVVGSFINYVPPVLRRPSRVRTTAKRRSAVDPQFCRHVRGLLSAGNALCRMMHTSAIMPHISMQPRYLNRQCVCQRSNNL